MHYLFRVVIKVAITKDTLYLYPDYVCTSLKWNTLNIQYMLWGFDFSLKARIILTHNTIESSIFCFALKNNLSASVEGLPDIAFFDWESRDFESFMTFTNKLIIIDNADLLISSQVVKNHISRFSPDNQYILIYEDIPRGIKATPNSYAKIKRCESRFHLEYPYFRPGWDIS